MERRQIGCIEECTAHSDTITRNDYPQRPHARHDLRTRDELRGRDAWRATAKRLTIPDTSLRIAPAFDWKRGRFVFGCRDGRARRPNKLERQWRIDEEVL